MAQSRLSSSAAPKVCWWPAAAVISCLAFSYANLFDGGICGVLGDSNKYSKKIVIHRIINENKLDGSQLTTFGDGPVELCESCKRDGFAIGIVSDKVRRYGLNIEKCARLIKAGAHIIISDFSQIACFLKFFGA